MPELTAAPTVEAYVEQVLTGLQIGVPGPHAHCCACGRTLHDGCTVTVYAYQQAGATDWNIPRVYCPECYDGKLKTATLGQTGVVATALLGIGQYAASQTTRFVLSEVELQKVSQPDEAATP